MTRVEYKGFVIDLAHTQTIGGQEVWQWTVRDGVTGNKIEDGFAKAAPDMAPRQAAYSARTCIDSRTR